MTYVTYLPYVLTCLRASLFLRALSAIIFYVLYVLSFSYGPYVSSVFMCITCLSFFYELYLSLFFTCLHFLNVLWIFLYGFIFLRAFTCFLEECDGIFPMNLMILFRFLICCHQQHNAKPPQNWNKYTVNGKTCKIDNLIYFTIFINPKFLYLHLKTFSETHSDE